MDTENSKLFRFLSVYLPQNMDYAIFQTRIY